MQKKLNQNIKNALIVLASLLVMGVLTSIKFDYYYDLNDDTTIRDILSGIYTGKPSGFNIQMLYPLNILIAGLYMLIPSLPWYGAILVGLEYACFGVILFVIIQKLGEAKKYTKLLVYGLSVLFIFGVYFRWLIFQQYTVVSGLLMATAIFLFGTIKNKISQVISIILVVTAFLIRTEMCLMLLPVLGLVWLSNWCSEKDGKAKENIKYYVETVLVALLLMGAFIGIDRVAYKLNANAESWTEYRAFFDSRTKLYDFYGIPEYSEEMGLTKNQYVLLKNYNFALDDKITSDTLNQVNEYTEKQLNPVIGKLYTRKTVKEAIWSYKNMLLHANTDVMIAVILTCYFLYAFILFSRNRLKSIWKLILLFMFTSALFIYLFMVERSIDRVTFPLLLAQAAILAVFIIRDLTECNGFLKHGMILFMLIIVGCIWLDQYPKTAKEFQEREGIAFVNDELKSYTQKHTDEFYYIDVFSTTSYEGVVISEKIFKDVDNSFRNYDICGGWLAKSPLAYKKKVMFNQKDELNFICYPEKNIDWLENICDSVEPVDNIYTNGGDLYLVYKVHKLSCN